MVTTFGDDVVAAVDQISARLTPDSARSDVTSQAGWGNTRDRRQRVHR
jgi:hypothetical protein